MAEPLQNLRSLNEVSTGYSIFEPDQVLNDSQLNSLTRYLDDQERLTRVELLGVGIIGGLQVSTAGNSITVSKGVGVTTDGDLLMLPADTIYDRCKVYGESAPAYQPFYVDTVMRKVFELVPKGENDALAESMSTLPGPLSDMVVVMLMESYEKDPDMCSGSDCDNLGRDAINSTRVMVVSRSDAGALLSVPGTVRNAALALPELIADRPQITGKITTTTALAKLYRDACKNIHAALSANLGKLFIQLPNLVGDLFGSDPGPGWVARLNTIQSEFANRNVGIQYYYSFLKDLVDTWNELREALLDDDSVLCPDLAAFPKHLVLGDLTDPAQSRTGLYPSPLVGGCRGRGEHARFLMRKLHAILTAFNLPTDSTLPVVVTPSRSEAAGLEERAIPYYYAVGADLFPIQRHWNYRLTKRGAESSNLGYRAKDYGGTAVAQNPLATQIGRYEFFRIEGHLGQNVDQAKKAIEELTRTRNLPFLVRAVLLNSDRKKIVVKPPIRYGDLHRFHYLIRNDVATHLKDSNTFNEQFKIRIDKALSDGDVPDQQISNTANSRHSEVKSAIQSVQPAMASKRYADYREDVTWKGTYSGVVNATGNFKSALGDVVRTDLTTPFDSLAISNHPAWLDWLDTLIQTKDDREDDKLLFANFLAAHPGFEHFGGVARGGTFVLVYDDSGQVVADGMLPYHWPEVAEDQPDEPDLKPPVFRPPVLIDNSVKVKPPIDVLFQTKLTAFQTAIEPVWKKELDIQKDYFKFFKDSVGAFSDIVTPKQPGRLGLSTTFGDDLLSVAVSEVQTRTEQIDRLRAILSRPDITDDQRNRGLEQLKGMQSDLASSIVKTTQYISTSGVDVASSADGGKAMAIIASSAIQVSDSSTRDQMQTGLKNAQSSATSPQFGSAVGNLIQTIGFRQ